ncbi:MAG: Gluconeogenesis factor [Phycisphaerae bacterium]|nr:Gluconeogenesis factor [Phycisphaerae bacterium]
MGLADDAIWKLVSANMNQPSPHTSGESPASKETGQVPLTRQAIIPDAWRIARYRKCPEYGPKLLFFSGGSALAQLSRHLIDYTHNSIHLVTPFDSGGSSATFREAFDMPAVGDLRNRLMALADHTVSGHPDVYQLFATRLPRDADDQQLRRRLKDMVAGEDPLITNVVDPMRKLIRNHLRYFHDNMPADFDLRGASIGNMILVGGYLNNERHLDPVAFLFSKLVEVRGIVRTILGDSYQLAAELSDGRQVTGQHQLTGKEVSPLPAAIQRIWLVNNLEQARPVQVEIREKIKTYIAEAELICYPMGSFFTSIIANLLPNGVGQSIAGNGVPKIYIPNTGHDPEELGHTVADRIQLILAQLRCDGMPECSADKLLNYVLVDSQQVHYAHGLDLESIRRQGVTVIDQPLITPQSQPYLDPDRLIAVLLSLV